MSLFYKIFFASLLFCNSNSHGNNPWVKLNSPTTATLRSCTFVDEFNGWCAGDSGIIIHTSNGGNSFIIQTIPIDYHINDIFFINKRLGWVVSNEFLLEGTTISKTTNGGINWTAKNFPDTSKIFRTIFFLDSLTGYLGGLRGIIFKTTDAGESWFETNVDSSEFSGYPIAKFKFVSNEFGFACGGRIDIVGVVWRTTNAGLFWNAQGLSPEPFYDLFIKSPLNILAVGGDFEYGVQINTTSNAGINWHYQSLGLFGQAYSIDYRTPKEAWMALGYAENWAVSYDSGSTWSVIPVVDSSDIYSVTFVDSLHGWAVGAEGVILKYNPMTFTSDPAQSNIPFHFFLKQNYPNPFNPVTLISYDLYVSGYVKLRVFNVNGEEVKLLINKKQNEGSYTVKFDGSNFPSGMYYCKLEIYSIQDSKKYQDVKKMVLVR